jgi:putative transposase
MARAHRIDFIGYYHVINRGVEKRVIFLDNEDFEYFLALIDELQSFYGFHLHSYCLMSNHYHLLIETTSENLSLILKQLNQRYTLYFNKKYKRIGTLWQGRFKSWYVNGDQYLEVLRKYIENNPVKAGLSVAVGQYPWASETTKDSLLMEDEQELLDLYQNEKIVVENKQIVKKKSIPLGEYFLSFGRNRAIIVAVSDGYSQSEVASYLNLSCVAISKIIKIEKQKENLFSRLQKKGIFWSYATTAMLHDLGDAVFVEYTLKYGDFDDIVELFSLYGKKVIFKIWEKEQKNDLRFKKLNLMLARVFFGMNVEADYFTGGMNERERKLRLLAS